MAEVHFSKTSPSVVPYVPATRRFPKNTTAHSQCSGPTTVRGDAGFYLPRDFQVHVERLSSTGGLGFDLSWNPYKSGNCQVRQSLPSCECVNESVHLCVLICCVWLPTRHRCFHEPCLDEILRLLQGPPKPEAPTLSISTGLHYQLRQSLGHKPSLISMRTAEKQQSYPHP